MLKRPSSLSELMIGMIGEMFYDKEESIVNYTCTRAGHFEPAVIKW